MAVSKTSHELRTELLKQGLKCLTIFANIQKVFADEPPDGMPTHLLDCLTNDRAQLKNRIESLQGYVELEEVSL